jgi:hypothetical protein
MIESSSSPAHDLLPTHPFNYALQVHAWDVGLLSASHSTPVGGTGHPLGPDSRYLPPWRCLGASWAAPASTVLAGGAMGDGGTAGSQSSRLPATAAVATPAPITALHVVPCTAGPRSHAGGGALLSAGREDGAVVLCWV